MRVEEKEETRASGRFELWFRSRCQEREVGPNKKRQKPNNEQDLEDGEDPENDFDFMQAV